MKYISIIVPSLYLQNFHADVLSGGQFTLLVIDRRVLGSANKNRNKQAVVADSRQSVAVSH